MIEHLNKDGFVWWQGVVVDRNDPFKIGRCKVRILGYHGEKEDIPDDDLPWAYPAMPINVRPNSVATGLVEGVWVLGFFRDGNDAQEPVITHLINYGKQKDGDFQVRSENTGAHPTGGMNTNRLAQGDSKDTVIDNIHNKDLPDNYPESKYDAKFPYNYVEESESGHVIQIDDTEGAERLSVTHRSGTFIEIHPDGTTVSKVVGKRYTVIMSDEIMTVRGDVSIDVDGTRKITVVGDSTSNIGGDYLEDVEGTSTEDIEGLKTIESKGYEVKSGSEGIILDSEGGSVSIDAGGNRVDVKGRIFLN